MGEGIYVTWETLIKAASILGALGLIIGLIVKGVHWLDKQEQQSADIDNLNSKHDTDIGMIQNELAILTYGVLACLKGLQEKGCNGPVTETISEIETYLNNKAHDRDKT